MGLALKVALVSALATPAALAVSSTPAHACTCVAPSIEEHLERAEAAFVGTMLQRDARASTVKFRIEEVAKGDLPPAGTEIDVVESACAFDRLAAELAVFLRRGPKGW